MTADQRANLVLAFAKTLYVNGQATEQTVDAAKRLGRALGLRTTIIPRWGELQLVADSEDAALAVQAVVAPAGIEMVAWRRRCGRLIGFFTLGYRWQSAAVTWRGP
jgi:hypothetical protein